MSNSSTVSINTYNKGKFMMKRKNVVLHLYEARKFASGAILEKTWSNSLFFPFFLVHYKCHTVNMLSFSFLQPKLVKLNAKFKTKVFSFTRITSRLVFRADIRQLLTVFISNPLIHLECCILVWLNDPYILILMHWVYFYCTFFHNIISVIEISVLRPRHMSSTCLLYAANHDKPRKFGRCFMQRHF